MSRGGLVTCDLAVVGAGAAGLAAALQGVALGLDVVVATRGRPGGRLLMAERLPLVDGFPVGLSGEELVERALRQAGRLGVRVMSGAEVTALAEPAAERRRLVLATGQRIDARTVVIATGVERATAEVQDADRLIDAGVYTRRPGPGGVRAAGTAYVAGDPAAAARAALDLSDGGGRVTVITSDARPSRVIPQNLLRELRTRPNVAALPCAQVVGVDGMDRLEVVLLRDTRTGRLRARTASSLWLMGVERGRAGWLPGSIERDDSGRLRTGRVGDRLASETALRRVFAAGDARAGAPCGLLAIPDGLDAAEQACARLRLDMETAA
ncbi:MAG TPA: FAD-dependent oxidoreductase [Gemmatimonadota bacterium]|nr:FAD-dependent oxidoreductase [Gemmatimonadota bacterium]